MADKSNALTHGHALWLRVFDEVAAQYPSIASKPVTSTSTRWYC
jgi:isocitrate/isopropylmalate dehydrogenase